MIFKNYPSAAVKYQMMRRKIDCKCSAHSSLESVKGGLFARRRSLSLDDLGLANTDNGSPMPSYNYVAEEEETDDEAIDELPEDCNTLELLKHSDPDTDAGEATNSLSSLREASSPTTAEEWSPSPIGIDTTSSTEDDENAHSLNSSSGVPSKKSKSVLQSVLAKWRNRIKK